MKAYLFLNEIKKFFFAFNISIFDFIKNAG